VKVLHSVGALEDVVIGLPALEVGVVPGDLGDVLGQHGVVRLASGVQP
jgi:hypothetical protein